MKQTTIKSPTNTTITNTINRNRYAEVLTLQITSKNDLKSIPKTIEDFVSNDLQSITILVLKHQ
jgi:hypothetical protein